MTLQVIGAGFGRTGTLSLKLALEQLGFGPCYHMIEVFKNPAAAGWWSQAADGRPDWTKIFEGYDTTVDWPAATFYAELAKAYPDAKVILTRRDPDAWFRSTQSTIFSRDFDGDGPFDEMFRKVIATLFDGELHDRDSAVEVFNRHNAAVQEALPADRLLVYDVAEGWGPLCAFLGVDIPSAPMPHANSTEEFVAQRLRSIPST